MYPNLISSKEGFLRVQFLDPSCCIFTSHHWGISFRHDFSNHCYCILVTHSCKQACAALLWAHLGLAQDSLAGCEHRAPESLFISKMLAPYCWPYSQTPGSPHSAHTGPSTLCKYKMNANKINLPNYQFNLCRKCFGVLFKCKTHSSPELTQQVGRCRLCF